jgi:hypothetical protein
VDPAASASRRLTSPAGFSLTTAARPASAPSADRRGHRARCCCGLGRHFVCAPTNGPSPVAQTRRPNEALAGDISRQPLNANQLAAKLFDSVVIETVAEPYGAIGNAALGDEAPEDLLQDPGEIHDAARRLSTVFGRVRLIVRQLANAPNPP